MPQKIERPLRATKAEPSDRGQIVRELRELKRILEPKKSSKWYDRIYSFTLTLTKYVGIPGLVIAAIGPLQKLMSDFVEYENRQLIQQVYLDYASNLMNEGSFDRANKLLSTLEGQKDFDARLQYYKAKVLIAMAIQQGKNYPEALDTASILTKIAARGSFIFPSIAATDDLIDLNFSIADIQIAQQNYEEARKTIAALECQKRFIKSSLFGPSKNLRLGTIDVLQYKLKESKYLLSEAIAGGDKANQKLLSANATFQLAKAHQFNSENKKALVIYDEAIRRYEDIQDKFGLLRAYNNKAMIYFNEAQNSNARAFYNKEQILAREVGDELGYARATANIAIIEKREKNYSGAINLALEALGVFRQQHNILGIGTTSILLANIYEIQNNFPEALAYANEDLASSLQLRELRGVTAACGTLSNIFSKMNNKDETIFSSLCAAALITQLKLGKMPYAHEDLDIFMSRIRGANTDMGSARNRVRDIFVTLNLDVGGIDDLIKTMKGVP